MVGIPEPLQLEGVVPVEYHKLHTDYIPFAIGTLGDQDYVALDTVMIALGRDRETVLGSLMELRYLNSEPYPSDKDKLKYGPISYLDKDTHEYIAVNELWHFLAPED